MRASFLACLCLIAVHALPARADGQRAPDGGPGCVRELELRGAADDVALLRAALANSGLREAQASLCSGAVVQVERRGDLLHISLSADGARVDRDVHDVAAAAGWIEGWLTGTSSAPATAPEGATVDVAAPAAGSVAPDRPVPAPAAPAPGPRVSTEVQLALTAATALGNDRSAWAGLDLAPRLQVAPIFWLGGALGGRFDTTWAGPAGASTDTSRVEMHAAMRGGARLPLSGGTRLLLGAGVGVVWGMAIRSFEGGDDDDINQGGLYAELLADVMVPFSEHLFVLAGIGGRGAMLTERAREDGTERLVPDALPPLLADVHLGAGWTFGGAR